MTIYYECKLQTRTEMKTAENTHDKSKYSSEREEKR